MLFEQWLEAMGLWLAEVEAVANGDEVFGQDLEAATDEVIDLSLQLLVFES